MASRSVENYITAKTFLVWKYLAPTANPVASTMNSPFMMMAYL